MFTLIHEAFVQVSVAVAGFLITIGGFMGIPSTMQVPTSIDTSALEQNSQIEPADEKAAEVAYQSEVGAVTVIDNLIVSYNSLIKYANDFNSNVIYYSESATKSRAANTELSSSESDLYLKGWWDYNEKIFYGVVHYSALEKVKNDAEINKAKSVIVELQRKKSTVTNAEAAELLAHFDYINATLEGMHSRQQSYLESISLSMDMLSNSQSKVTSYMSSATGNSAPSAVYRQPTVLAPIQIPKTTYCTVHGTGINNNYDISCS